jgi:predicted double-glycine peptidase
MTLGWRWQNTLVLAGVFVCAALIAGCATPQVAQMQSVWPADVPARAYIDNVPFVPQEDYQCGPAALSMVAQTAGVQQNIEKWVEQVYLPARQGALQSEMLVASRRNGLPAYQLQPQLDALLREVAAGNPVLVLQNLSFSFAPVWHYAVVIGFDSVANTITLHSGRTERLHMSLYTFERTWARGNFWAMVALSPQRVPATAVADTYVASVVALERTRPDAAQTAYTSALQAWPQHRLALLGAGNTAYTLGQLNVAANAYRRATQVHPDYADAWNNLAQVLLEQRQHVQALEAAQHAVTLGGARVDRYRELEAKIQSQIEREQPLKQ